jgi:predicted glycosyltransferase
MNSTPHRQRARKAKIWIDLDNSPHVPFFAPIIDELQNRGYSIMLTARNAYQVRELADLFRLKYKLIGHHQGKNKIRKLFGVCVRGMQLIPAVLREKPDLALSHGSRSQIMVCAGLRIPSLLILDYECAKRLGLIEPTWYMCPEVIPSSVFRCDPKRVLKYPGIKEDVYVPRFVPDPQIRPELGFDNDDVVVTVRPPATEAHYHRPQSDELFEAVIEFLSRRPEVKIVMLPRNDKQAAHLRNHWPALFENRKIRIPHQVVDGLNLIWHSDLVISGGGTMNREAAALGVPVYSTFRGKIGAVDQYLSDRDRLVLLEGVQDVHTKIRIVRRNTFSKPQNGNNDALKSIVDQVVAMVGSNSPAPYPDSYLKSTSVHTNL